MEKIEIVKEQLQEDILSIIDGWNIGENMNDKEYQEFADALCDAVIHNLNKLKTTEK